MLTTAFVLSFLIAFYFPKSLALTRLRGRNLLKFRGLRLKSTLLENILVEDVEVSTALPRRTIPVVNTAGLNISAANFFGRQVFSVDECRLELVGLLRGEIEIEEEFLHYRVEYLTKYLEYKYIPIQTIPFLNFALSGEWDILYSNAITPRADDCFSYKTSQEISGNESEGGNGGVLNNVIRWKLNRPDEQCSGDLVVSCQYQLNTKGDLDITLVEHLLIPQGDAPRDVEDLIMSVQKSVPFESFDPNDIRMQNTVRLQANLIHHCCQTEFRMLNCISSPEIPLIDDILLFTVY